MKRIILSVLIVLFNLNDAEAQLFGFSPSEAKEVVSKKLLVLTDVESEKYVAVYKDKLSSAKEKNRAEIEADIAFYQKKADVYNGNILGIVNKHWKLGDKSDIRLVTEAELNGIKSKSNAKEYAVLYPMMMKKREASGGVHVTKVEIPSIAIQPVADYSTENKLFSFSQVISGLDESNTFDLELTVLLLNNFMEMAAKSTAKKVNISDWVDEEISANCGQISSKPLSIGPKGVGKKAEKLKAAYTGELKIVEENNLEKAYNMASDELVGLVYPVSINSPTPGGSPGIPQYQSLLVIRLSVEPSTGRVYGMSKPVSSQYLDELVYEEKELKQMCKCDGKK